MPKTSAGDVRARDPLRVARKLVSGPRRYVHTWYVAYLLLGVSASGLLPIVLPLMLEAQSHQPMTVGLVIGAWDLGLLSAPLWGVAAERYRLYGPLFFASLGLTGLACALMPLVSGLWNWFFAALGIGVGQAGAATLASLLIVDFSPKAEWEPRVGALQSFNGAGQVLGLLLAASFSRGVSAMGLWLAAALLLPAMVLAGMGLPESVRWERKRKLWRRAPAVLDVQALSVFPMVNAPANAGLQVLPSNLSGLRRLPEVANSAYGRLLLSWFLFAFGAAGFFTYLPLMLASAHGISSHLTANLYAFAAAVGIGLFLLTSRWCQRYGALRVYRAGLWLRLLAFVLLLASELVPVTAAAAGAVGLVVIGLAWPVISVSSTNLAARLAPFGGGAALGLFNAVLALADVMGTFASAPLVRLWGYRTIPAVAIVCLAAAILLGRGLEAS